MHVTEMIGADRQGPEPRRLIAILLCGFVLFVGVTGAALGGGGGRAPAALLSGPVASTGYWLVGSDGGVFAYGQAHFYGSTGAMTLNRPIVGMASTPDGHGYWMVASDGGVFAYGDAGFFGSTGAEPLNNPVVAMAASPSGHGYWLVASDGGVFAFGDAGFSGSMGDRHLNRPVVGLAATPSGAGYWMVASDGGVFAFGDAGFHGSAADRALASPMVSIGMSATGQGYLMGAGDGGVFTYGDAAFLGSASGHTPIGTVADLLISADGGGYWMVSTDGAVLTFGSAPFFGSAAGLALVRPIVGMASSAGSTVNPQDYSMSGDAPTALTPGTSVTIDLRVSNPNSAPITLVSTITTVTTSDPLCGPANFTVTQRPTHAVTVPAGASATLSELGVAPVDRPVVTMVDTGANQDACQDVRLTLHYQGEAIG